MFRRFCGRGRNPGICSSRIEIVGGRGTYGRFNSSEDTVAIAHSAFTVVDFL